MNTPRKGGGWEGGEQQAPYLQSPTRGRSGLGSAHWYRLKRRYTSISNTNIPANPPSAAPTSLAPAA